MKKDKESSHLKEDFLWGFLKVADLINYWNKILTDAVNLVGCDDVDLEAYAWASSQTFTVSRLLSILFNS